VSDSLDLMTPEAVARLRHYLRTSLNQIIGYAEVVYRQAKDQGARSEMELMEQVMASARRLGDMVAEALPASSHVGDGSIPRLQAAMQGYVDRITDSVDRFQQISRGACEPEIDKIRLGARSLLEFSRGIEPRPAPDRAYPMPPAGTAAAQAGPANVYTMPPPGTAEVREDAGRVYTMPPAGTLHLPDVPRTRTAVAGGRILVVDDDAQNRDLLERRLAREGFTTASEPNGRAALARLRREGFDIVLLDIFMPEVNGFQVLAAMKAAPELREIPVIVLSAVDDQEHIVRSIEMGADDFLAKPFDPVVLRARIGAIFRRREAETQRAQIAQRLESLLESSGEGIFGLNADGVCTFVNRAALEMLGRPREALLGHNLHEVVHHTRPDGSPYPRSDCPIESVLRTGQPSRGRDERFLRADGSSFPIEFSAHPMRHGENSDGMVVTFTDISERKQTEEHLLQTAKLESLGVLAGGIAHDFNNILTGIMGNASLVLETLGPQDLNRSLLTDVVRSSERAADLTRQLLAYAGKGQFVLEAVDVSAAIQDIAELLGASVPKTARLDFHLAPGLPRFGADPRQIHQLAFNLVINAGDATEGRNGVIRVETGFRDLAEALAGEAPFGVIPPGSYVYLAVADNGSGMDPALRARIFDPFFSTKFAGRGLGLAAAMGIARTHHGAILVESEPGRGSRFEVLFPVEAPLRPESEPAARTPAEHLTILVVDDEDIVRTTTRAMLERRGYQVLLAENGREAVDIFRARAADIALVLLDLTMPVMGGDEAARYLRAIRHDVPILVSSGYPEGEVDRRFSSTRVRGYVRKPYTSATLIEKIQAALQ
jgi:PAS domain S-box-containing protein